MVDERTAYWGERDAARYRTRDDDPTGGDYVVAETLDANGNPVEVLLRWDDTAGEWVSGGPVNMDGNDLTNVGSLDAGSVSTDKIDTSRSWNEVTNNRSASTTETNTTGSEIIAQVVVEASADNTEVGISWSVNGAIATGPEEEVLDTGERKSLSVHVPAESDYTVNFFRDTANFDLLRWDEFRP